MAPATRSSTELRYVPHTGARIDGEHDGGGVVPPVFVGKRVDARQRAGPQLEVLAYGVNQFIVVSLAAMAVDLHVGVDVDRRDTREINSVFVLLACHCAESTEYDEFRRNLVICRLSAKPQPSGA